MSENNSITNSLIKRIVASSGNDQADMFSKSEVVNNKDFFTTPVPAINIALGGEINGGMEPGLLQVVGESKSFKTLFMLILAKSYMDKYENSVFVLFDSEHGAAKGYFASIGIDMDRVVHCPIVTVEDLRGQINKILNESKRGEKIFFGVDSIGLLASAKEVNDAISGNEAADMTRAKALNSLFRTIVSQLPLKDMPMVVINHSYDSIGGFIPTKTVKGGKGNYLASNDIWMITRANDRQKSGDKELNGFKFTINIEKSRTVKEKSKIPVMVSFENGIDKHSGLLEIAENGGFIVHSSKGKYKLKGTDEEFKEKNTGPMLEFLLKNEEFKEYVKSTFKQTGKKLIQDIMNDIEDDDE